MRGAQKLLNRRLFARALGESGLDCYEPQSPGAHLIPGNFRAEEADDSMFHCPFPVIGIFDPEFHLRAEIDPETVCRIGPRYRKRSHSMSRCTRRGEQYGASR